jgi:hypothetical protein
MEEAEMSPREDSVFIRTPPLLVVMVVLIFCLGLGWALNYVAQKNKTARINKMIESGKYTAVTNTEGKVLYLKDFKDGR